jgi:hypothetical protein
MADPRDHGGELTVETTMNTLTAHRFCSPRVARLGHVGEEMVR